MSGPRPEQPKYAAIRDEIREMVTALPVGQSLPPERELAERWGVARMTVRQAIAEVAQEGLLHTVHRHGHRRAPDPIPLRVRLGSFAQAVEAHHTQVTTEVLELTARPAAPPPVRGFLGEADLIMFRRLRLGDGVPLALETAWLLADVLPEPTPEMLAGSVYQQLRAHGSLPDTGEEVVRADLPTAEEAKLLKVIRSRPVFRLSRRAASGGRPVEYAEAVLPADRYELCFPLQH